MLTHVLNIVFTFPSETLNALEHLAPSFAHTVMATSYAVYFNHFVMAVVYF